MEVVTSTCLSRDSPRRWSTRSCRRARSSAGRYERRRPLSRQRPRSLFPDAEPGGRSGFGRVSAVDGERAHGDGERAHDGVGWSKRTGGLPAVHAGPRYRSWTGEGAQPFLRLFHGKQKECRFIVPPHLRHSALAGVPS